MGKKRQLLGKWHSRLLRSQLVFPLCILITLAAGITIGYLMPKPAVGAPGYELATALEVSQAKQEIRNGFEKQSTTDCAAPVDGDNSPSQKEIFEKYLKVNKYANRAVIRGCANYDSLLVKNPLTNEWEQTSVNMALDARANPVWQAECMIDDITFPDEKVRPENSSIDVGNLVECRMLKERDQVVYLLREVGNDPTEADVKSYVDGAEKFVEMVEKQK